MSTDPFDDPYDFDLRLCDDHGLVSHQPIDEDLDTLDKSYLDRLNRLRNMTLVRRGDKPETIEDPFVCTGNAHLAGVHIRCSSSAHNNSNPTVVAHAYLDSLCHEWGHLELRASNPGLCARCGGPC